MLDDLLELAADLVGDSAAEFLSDSTRKRRENAAAFRWALEQTRDGAPAVWAAWGAVIEKRPYLADCLRDMIAVGTDLGARWHSAGSRSKKGHPHHPLYLRKDSVLEPFDAEEYVQTCL